MSGNEDREGPWGSRGGLDAPPQPGPQPRRRLSGPVLAVLVVTLLGVLMLSLSRAFPGRLTSAEDWGVVGRGVCILALAGAALASRRLPLGRATRYGAAWMAIVAVLLAGYAYRSDFAAFVGRLSSEMIPSAAVAGPGGDLTLGRDQDGAYYAAGRVNGRPVLFLIDTGASDVVLSPADARRLGVDTAAITYGGVYETANGQGRGAAYKAAELAVGPIRFTDVAMSINQAPMRTSLLGMSFLRRLRSFRFEGDRLVMRP